MGFRSPLFAAGRPEPLLPPLEPPEALPWAQPWPFGRRCRARLEPRPGRSHHGRCELAPGHYGDHALERGFDTPRWSTNLTGY